MEGQEARGPEIPASTPQELSHNAGVAENSLGTSDSGAGEGLPVTDEELAATLSVLRRLAKVPDLHKKARYMNVRIACGKLVKDQQLKKTDKVRKADRKAKKRKIAEENNGLREQTGLRKNRLAKKQRLQYRCLPPPDLQDECEKPALLLEGAKDEKPQVTIESVPETEKPKLARDLSCYICKRRFDTLHHFYDLLCPECAELNFEKRNQMVDLTGRIALVTGGRIKIGFEAVVRLLRCGATVIVTTRFPKDAVLRYSQEADYKDWKDRLHFYGLDLRQLPALHKFLDHIKETYTHLDMIINNAAQTVRRPPSFYSHLMGTEALPLSQLPINETAVHLEFGSLHTALTAGDSPTIPTETLSAAMFTGDPTKITEVKQRKEKEEEEEKEEKEAEEGTEKETKLASVTRLAPSLSPSVVEGISPSAALSVVPLIAGDEVHDVALFPPNRFDVDNQQVDLRTQNSWTMPLEQVSTVEMIETMAINSFAPFIINSKLKDMLIRSGRESFIINVSAMEGQFYRKHKTDYHPHTNMAKAALNMMTRTSALAYARDRIYMNSVDTGWINDESPHPIAQENAKMGFSPPIDELDGAMRVLDPIFHGIKTGEFIFGSFLKDYKTCPW